MANEQVVEGGVFQFIVVAKNKFGTVVPVTDVAVATDNAALGSLVVNHDGTGGVFTAATGTTGTVTLTPSAGGVTGTPYPLDVVADMTIVSVTIQPAPAPIPAPIPAPVPAPVPAPAPASGQPT